MTDLQKRMIESFQLRGMSERTQEAYVRAVRQLAQHSHKSPDLVTEEELRQYFLYIKNVKNYARGTTTIALRRIKFFIEWTLGRKWTLFEPIINHAQFRSWPRLSFGGPPSPENVIKSRSMVPDFEQTIPDRFHQQDELERFFAESRARFDAREKNALKRRIRYFVGTAICWSAAALVFLILNKGLRDEHDRAPLMTLEPIASSVRSSTAVPAHTTIVSIVQDQTFPPPFLPEPDQMKRLLDELGAIEVQGSLYTSWGKSYQGSLWVRKVTRGERIYLNEALHYEVDRPFRLRLPADSTVYLYAQVPGLAWNGGWGVPIQIPSSINCSQPGLCALSLEELMVAATTRR